MNFPKEKFDEILGAWLGKDIDWLGPEIETLFTKANEEYVKELREKMLRLKSPDSCAPSTHIFKIDAVALIDGHSLKDDRFDTPKVTLPGADEPKMYRREAVVKEHLPGIQEIAYSMKYEKSPDTRKGEQREHLEKISSLYGNTPILTPVLVQTFVRRNDDRKEIDLRRENRRANNP